MKNEKKVWNEFRPYAYMIEHHRLDMPISQAKEAAFALDRSLNLKIMALRLSAVIFACIMAYGLWWALSIEPSPLPKPFVYFASVNLFLACMLVPENTIIRRWRECREYRRVESMANDYLRYKQDKPSLSVAEYGNMCLDEYRM